MSQWIEKSRIAEKEEIALWNECVFVFDSSALLNFYEYSTNTQKNIFEKIFKQLVGRLWVPNHVRDEYLKNRQTTLKKPISQYRDLLEKDFKQLKSKFVDIRNVTKMDERHPFIDQSIFNELEFALEKFEELFKRNVEEKIKEIVEYEKNDLVFETFQEMLRVGDEYDFTKIIKVVAEGEFRYKHKIPPGYNDLDGKGKVGLQVYGDLIIWKQIIDFARSSKKPIVLINDDKKDDWWVRSGKDILAPREELVREIRDLATVNFWMYTSSEFLERANNILKAKLDTDTIKEVRTLINTLKAPDWEGFLNRSDFVKLNGYQFANCIHPNLKHIVTILWNYRDYKILLNQLSNPDIEIPLNETYDLEKYSYLLLNPHMERQQWLYKIEIVNGKISLELLFGANKKLEIVDQQ